MTRRLYHNTVAGPREGSIYGVLINASERNGAQRWGRVMVIDPSSWSLSDDVSNLCGIGTVNKLGSIINVDRARSVLILADILWYV